MNKYNVPFYIVALMLFIMPIYQGMLLSYASIALFIVWLSDSNWKLKWHRLIENRISLLFIAYFIWAGLSFFWSSNSSNAAFDLEVKLPFLTLPILLLATSFKEKVSGLLNVFVLGTAVGGVLNFARSLISYCETQQVNEFLYANLSHEIHPSYLAIYTTFSIGIICYSLLNKKQNKYIKFGLVGLIVFLSIYVVLLQSRMGLLVYCLQGFILLGYLVLVKKKMLLSASIVVGFMLLILGIFQLSDVPKNRLKAMFKQKQQTEQSTPSTRIYLWKASLSKIYESPIFGYGIGNYKEELIDEYDSRDMQKAKRIQLNSHNQFLDNWLAGGVVYFLLLIALVVEQFRIFIKSKSVIYGLFISSFTIFLLVESALQTKAGIFYFILFSSILYQSLNDSIFTTKSRR